MGFRERWNHTVKALWRAVLKYIYIFLTMNYSKIYLWFPKQLLALLCEVLSDIFCSVPFHSIKNAGSKPLK